MGDGDGFYKEQNFEVEHGPNSLEGISVFINNSDIPFAYRVSVYIELLNKAKVYNDVALLALLNKIRKPLFNNES